MGNIKEISIKNRSDFFFDDMVKIPDFNANSLKIDKSHAKTLEFITLDISQRKILNM